MFQTAPRAWGWFTTSQCPAPHCSRNLTPLTPRANGHSHLPCAVVPIHAHSLVSPSPRALGEEEIQLKGAQCLHSTAGGRPRPQHDIVLLMLPFSLSRLERSSSISPILEQRTVWQRRKGMCPRPKRTEEQPEELVGSTCLNFFTTSNISCTPAVL